MATAEEIWSQYVEKILREAQAVGSVLLEAEVAAMRVNQGLELAVERGEPLADFTISFAAGLDFAALTDRFNELGDDIGVEEPPYAGFPTCGLAPRRRERWSVNSAG
ncbi:MAG: hypothetical protein JWO38_7909 [Gemmataceae bacterium]|nr:hypothetical protein [Gemmataceae bacterium]